jgi:hypothetical protein
MKGDKSFFRKEAAWTAIVHYGLLLLSLLALLFSLLVG